MEENSSKVEYTGWEAIYKLFVSIWPEKTDYPAYYWIYRLMEPPFTCETAGLEERLRAAKQEYEDKFRARFPTVEALRAEDKRRDEEALEGLLKWLSE